VMQEMHSRGGDVIVVDSDLQECDGPQSESPECSSPGEAWHSNSEASPRAVKLEGPSVRRVNVDRAGGAGAEGCPSFSGGGMGAAFGVGAVGDSGWPLDSGPGLWEDQDEWGFLGVTFDAETQVGLSRKSIK
jgi:hypothetical protein